MEKRKVTKNITEYYKVCPVCKKEIKGTKKSQVEYNLKIHLEAKHKKGGKNEVNKKPKEPVKKNFKKKLFGHRKNKLVKKEGDHSPLLIL